MIKNTFFNKILKKSLKTIVLGFMLITIGIINIGCSKDTIVINSNDTDKKIISNDLFQMYLEEYLDDSMSDDIRITEYKITGTKIKEEKSDGFKFVVIYEFKPYNWDKYPISEKERQAWEELQVVYAHAYVDVKNTGSEYKIINVDTKQPLNLDDMDF